VDDSYHQLADLAVELEKRGRDLDVDPARLDWVEERLNTLAKLKRKYNLSLTDIIKRARELTDLLNELDGAGLDLARLRRERDEARAKAVLAARNLSAARLKTAEKLQTVLTGHLKPLGFPKIEMRVAVDAPAESESPEALEKRLGPDGFDRVEFLFCPNPGEGLKPLAKIASGGELSRFMLALKTAPERSGDQLMVFDEIDAGLGGVTAEAVAAKMAELSARQQLIVITHLPQMAALAGRHFVVSKEAGAKSGRTVTSINLLEEERRVDELARMLGGSAPSPEALALAGQLLAGMKRR
ncbi:DNA repair protein RecN, partial [Deltaproteobacteria bacterium OttesenSCG-928-K17]|nr:DNA repair protein RecN [Deltaproteobacteria bacterium OttesenSCG-928-K17]